jgi:hypothetical protein
MPFEIDYGRHVPIGFAAEAVAKGTPNTRVRFAGFYSSEDGDEFLSCLDGFSSMLLDRMPPGKRPRESQVDHFVAIIRKGGKATLYVNELSLTGMVSPKRAFKAGDPISKDDIADIHKASFDGIAFPADAGIVFLVSVGWRKGLFFDYMPLHPIDPQPRTADPNRILAEVVTYLSFPERLKITEDQWTELFRQRWFPFIGLSTDQLRAILTHATLKAPIDSLLDDMVDAARSNCRGLRELVAAQAELRDHRETLTKALEHFETADYLSCSSMLFPRIEGILRHLNSATPERPTQANLAAAAILDPKKFRHSKSLLFPDKFHEFLRDVYFADFDPMNVTDVSRHTVSHGVAPETKLNLKSAFMAVLILEQIVRLMPPLAGDGVDAAKDSLKS